MKALVYLGDEKIELMDIEYPKIENSHDAIVKVELSSICKSDLHIIHGKVPRAKNSIALGHEFTGEIISIGKDVKKIKEHDRVTGNCITFCGECYYCKNGFINNCEKGGWELGCTINGAQAEYVRVPFADNCLNKIQDSVTYEKALFVGDILSSGYFGASLSEIKECFTVAVIGAGPVGICSMICAKLLKASKVIAIDIKEERLSLVKEKAIADITINPNKEDYEKVISDLTKGKLADAVIEAAGGENTFEMAWKIARANSIVSLIAMYEKPQIFPLNEMYGKNLIFKTGGVDAIHSDLLLKFIEEGKIDTEFLITKKMPLNDIVKGYEIFEQDAPSCMKIAITPYIN